MEKYEKAVLELVELKNDVIRTSGGGVTQCMGNVGFTYCNDGGDTWGGAV